MSPSPWIISAVPTPFTARCEVDHDVFEQTLDYVAPHVDAVLVCGTSGEFPALDPGERTALIATAVERLGADRVVAQVGAVTQRQALELTDRALEVGARRFAAITPYFLPAPLSSVTDYYAALRQRIDGDLYAYIFPELAATDIRPRDIGALLDAGITGLKISGTASMRIANYLRRLPTGFPVLTGNDADIPRAVAAGGAGTISGSSAGFPQTFAALREAFAGGNRLQIEAAQAAASLCAHVAGPSIRRIKDVLAMRGIGRPFCRMAIADVDTAIARRLGELTTLYA